MANHNVSWLKRLWHNLKELSGPKTQIDVTWHSKDSNHHHRFIVIGLGRFGTSLAMTLATYDHDVLVVDSDMKRVQQASRDLSHVVQLDATNIDALREVDAESFDTGIVCIGADFEANLLATISLRKLGVPRVITKTRTTTQQEILQRVGVNDVILPEHEAGVRLARRLAAVDFVECIELNQDTGIAAIIVPGHLAGPADL